MYFNNAATTWPKPEVVYETVDECFRSLNSPERTVSDEGERCAAMMANCRRQVSEFFGIKDSKRLIFTPSATYSLNLAILGLDWHEGDRIVMSGLEHHAVSRPIRKVAREHGVQFETAPYTPDNPVDLDFVEDQLKKGAVKLLACTMASNVSGDVLPSKELGDLAERYGALYLVDAAQAAGILPVDVDDLKADMLGFAGHKGLFGPPGGGGLFVRKGIQLNSLAEGGTGKDSGKHEMSGRYPSNYEIGTHNLLAIVGMTAGVNWISETGVDTLHAHEQKLAERFLSGLSEFSGVTVYGSPDIAKRTSVVSLSMEGITPAKMAQWLAEEHNVSSRAGYHCAPLAHETIGTLPGDGTIRFSFGFSNTIEEVDQLLGFIAEAPRLEGQLNWVV
ncbi:MAG: aminotransferase class V-fold PLP-dependent enzyme [Pirellulaceae bacterium]|nr:aminotransferase class V-fold PLP-dependent enzyme [Pirellulaceae bacterium]MDP7019513.1 aminotransferase class V-fold PLP-dependent enzyme [Pirellulaceae bacterium]